MANSNAGRKTDLRKNIEELKNIYIKQKDKKEMSESTWNDVQENATTNFVLNTIEAVFNSGSEKRFDGYFKDLIISNDYEVADNSETGERKILITKDENNPIEITLSENERKKFINGTKDEKVRAIQDLTINVISKAQEFYEKKTNIEYVYTKDDKTLDETYKSTSMEISEKYAVLIGKGENKLNARQRNCNRIANKIATIELLKAFKNDEDARRIIFDNAYEMMYEIDEEEISEYEYNGEKYRFTDEEMIIASNPELLDRYEILKYAYNEDGKRKDIAQIFEFADKEKNKIKDNKNSQEYFEQIDEILAGRIVETIQLSGNPELEIASLIEKYGKDGAIEKLKEINNINERLRKEQAERKKDDNKIVSNYKKEIENIVPEDSTQSKEFIDFIGEKNYDRVFANININIVTTGEKKNNPEKISLIPGTNDDDKIDKLIETIENTQEDIKNLTEKYELAMQQREEAMEKYYEERENRKIDELINNYEEKLEESDRIHKEQIDEYDKKLYEIDAETERKIEEQKRLQEEKIEELKKEYDEKYAEIDDEREKEINEKIESITQEYETKIDDIVSEYSTERDKLIAEKENLEKSNEDLQNEIETVKEESQKEIEKIEEKNIEIIDEVNKEKDIIEEENRELKDDNEELLNEINNIKYDNQKEVDELNSNIYDLESKLNDADNQIENDSKTIESLIEKVNTLKNEKESLEKEYADLNEKYHIALKENDDKISEELGKELENIYDRIDSLENEIKENKGNVKIKITQENFNVLIENEYYAFVNQVLDRENLTAEDIGKCEHAISNIKNRVSEIIKNDGSSEKIYEKMNPEEVRKAFYIDAYEEVNEEKIPQNKKNLITLSEEDYRLVENGVIELPAPKEIINENNTKNVENQDISEDDLYNEVFNMKDYEEYVDFFSDSENSKIADNIFIELSNKEMLNKEFLQQYRDRIDYEIEKIQYKKLSQEEREKYRLENPNFAKKRCEELVRSRDTLELKEIVVDEKKEKKDKSIELLEESNGQLKLMLEQEGKKYE